MVSEKNESYLVPMKLELYKNKNFYFLRHITCVTMVEVAQRVMVSFVQMAHFLIKRNLNATIGIMLIAQLKPNFMN